MYVYIYILYLTNFVKLHICTKNNYKKIYVFIMFLQNYKINILFNSINRIINSTVV